MGKKISIDSEELREVAVSILPSIADNYDEIALTASSAAKLQKSTFGIGTLKEIPGDSEDLDDDDRIEIREQADRINNLSNEWNECYDFFYSCIYDTGVNIRATGKFLNKIAEEHEILDSEIATEFNDLTELIESNEFRSGQDHAPPPPTKPNNESAPPSDQPIDPNNFN